MKDITERMIELSAKVTSDELKISQCYENVCNALELLSNDFMEDGRKQLENSKREEI